MPIIPVSGISSLGADFKIDGLGPAGQIGDAAPATGGGSGFGQALQKAIGSLEQSQQTAATASKDLLSGQAQDVSQVVMQVEQASLDLQLASQVRNKVVDAYQEIMRTTV